MFIQDILFNKIHGGGGYLYNRLRYLRMLKKKEEERNNAETVRTDETTDNTDQVLTNDNYQMDDFLFLKTTVVSTDNLDKVKEKLKNTIEYRRQLLADEEIDLKEHFPYMFVHPELVRLANNFGTFFFYLVYFSIDWGRLIIHCQMLF